MHICIGNLTTIASDNGLVPAWCQAITWTNAGILLIRSLGTNFSGIISKIHTFSLKKIHLKMSSAKWWPSCLGLNVLTDCSLVMSYGIIHLCQHRIRAGPSQYPIQCGIIIDKILWRSSQGNFTWNGRDICHSNVLKNYAFRTVTTSLRGLWVKKQERQ